MNIFLLQPAVAQFDGASHHDRPRRVRPARVRCTPIWPEDWDIWHSGQWASWWPSPEQWYGIKPAEPAPVPSGTVLVPKAPDYPPPKRAKMESKDEVQEPPANPTEPPGPGFPTPVKEEVDEDQQLTQDLAAAVAQHQQSILHDQTAGFVFKIVFLNIVVVFSPHLFFVIPGAGLFQAGQQHTGPIPAWHSQQWADQNASSGNLIPNSFDFFFLWPMGFQERLCLYNIH